MQECSMEKLVQSTVYKLNIMLILMTQDTLGAYSSICALDQAKLVSADD